MGLLRKFTERHYFRRVIIYFSICCLISNVVPSVTLAGPEGAEVVHGQVSFQQSGLNTTIHASDKSIINYRSFDIARPEVVQFMQPSSSASVLNRILSANPTSINGTLLANGRVFFVNPAGVIIGGGARINVNQLVASGLNISNDSFINGQYEFVGGGGTVANYGDISARSVYLVGKQVTNAGNINCPDGYVVMAAGDRVFLGQPGSSVIVEIGSLEPPDQSDAQPSAEIANDGTVKVAGGTIILAAAGDAFSRPIMTNTGSLSTSNAKGDAGNISLQAGDGRFDNAGTITATSDSGAGGTVTANASEVVNTGTIDVSGAQGGIVALDAIGRLGQFGTIDTDGIEGDGGNINLTANGIVALGTDSLTTANAGTNGDGGEVIVYSPKAAFFEPDARVEAKGGSESGDGGFFEVSGHEYVKVEGQVDLTATNGATGNFLIDPRNIKIVSDASQGIGVGWGDWNHTTGELFASGSNTKIRIGYLETYLDTTNVIMSTGLGGSDGNSEGNITFMADRYLKSGKYWTGNPGDPTIPSDNSLTIIANNNIIFEPGSGIDFTGSGSVTLNVVNNVVIDADISLSGGNFTSTHIESDPENPGTLGIDFDNHFESSGLITTLGGDVDIDHAGAVTIGALIDTAGVAGRGSVEIAGSSIMVNDNIMAGNNITFYNAVTAASANSLQAFDAGGTLTAMGDIIKSSSGELVLNSGSVLHLGHNVKGTHVDGSSITFNGDIIADGVGVIQEFSATGTLTANGDIEKSTTGTLTLGSSVGTLYLGHNIRGTDPAGSNIVLNGYVIANGVGDNSEQEFYATGDLTTNNDIEKSTVGILTLGCDSGVLLLGHNVKGTHVDGSSITFNGDIIADGVGVIQEFSATGILTANGNIEKSTAGTLTLASGVGTLYLGHDVRGTYDEGGSTSNITFNCDVEADGTGANSNQQFSATGTLTANGNIKKSTAGTLTLGSGGGTLYLGHNVTTGDNAGSNITFADSIIANGTGAGGDQQFSVAGTLTANGTIEKNTEGSLTLGGGTLIDLNGAVNVQDGDLNLLDGVVAASGVKLSAGRDVILANSKTLTGEGTLTVEADRNIMLGGDTLAGDLILTADRDNSGGIDGGSMHALGTIIATNGDIVISASDDTIILDGDVHADVTDDGDILLNNNTLLADGVALWAGHDIILANGKSMTGDGELTLIADYDGDSDGTIRLGGNVMGDGIMFGDSTIVRNNSVIADGTDPVGQIFNAGTGVLKANGTITKNGTGNLTLSGGTLVDLDGAVNVQTGSLTVNAAKASLGDNITTLKNQTYNADVELAADVITKSTDNGNIDFLSTVDGITNGGQQLTVKTGGVTKFHDEFGGIKPLAALVTDAGGHTEIGSVTINLNGSSAMFGDPVLLTNNLTVNEAGGGNIKFAGTVDSQEGSNYTLTVNTAGGGLTIFGDAVGSDALDVLSDDEGLGAVTTDAYGTTQINGGLVTTTGNQTYWDPVTLGDNTILNGTNVTFAQILDSYSLNNWNLLVNASGLTKFEGLVGGTGPLASLTTDDVGSTWLWTNVTTTGAQTYNEDVDIMGDVTAESTGGADITFAETVDGAHNLIVNTAGLTKFEGIVGGTGPLTSLTTDGDAGITDSTQLFDNVTTSGTQTYNDAVELMGDVTAESTGGADITFAETVDGAHNLIVNTAGLTKFQDLVGGGGGALTSLLTDGSGTTELSDNVTTTGAQTYNDDVDLKGDVIAESTGGSDIT
ncbi:MAG TPA: filamentous hemagglutinin N-terminal domain-containing protein, partial [Sedimentisphaerales bacterium]|nr:filamentous hemagglutinin N-terminal domain-containing protein [Sedimentisphaerales bacterium]